MSQNLGEGWRIRKVYAINYAGRGWHMTLRGRRTSHACSPPASVSWVWLVGSMA